MAQKTYYVDSCIWINLFKKEGDQSKGVSYWKLAKDFIKISNIIVSTIVIKELSFKIEDKLSLAMTFFRDNESIKMIKTFPEDLIN